MDKIAFGNFLSQLRAEKDITQEKLAEILGVNNKTISKWECGNSTPDLEMLSNLADFYNVSLYELKECKRNKNILITKKDLQRIINKNDLKRVIVLKIIAIIIVLIAIIIATFSTIYTFTNYGQMKVYELKGSDEELYVSGFFIKTYNKYYLSITAIKYINANESFLTDKTSEINYSLTFGSYKSKYKQIKFESQTQVKEALPMLNFNIIGELLDENINHFFINIKYRNENNKDTTKSFKIILDKSSSNTRLAY